MYVSGFWLGVLVTIIGEIVLLLLLGIIRGIFGVSNHNDHETEIRQYEIDLPEELQKEIEKEIVRQEKERSGKNG